MIRAVALLGLVAIQADVESLIPRLGHEDPDVRARAAAEIEKIGKPALPALRKAAAAADQEVAARARELIERIDWPDPGPAVKGLALAIKAKERYSAEEPLLLRGRILNLSEETVTILGARVPPRDESGPFSLVFDGGPELHFCFLRREPAPDVPEKLVLRKGERYEFAFSPRAWCALVEHSKCRALDPPAGEHSVSLALDLRHSKDAGWTDKATSNKVSFTVAP